MRRPEQVGIVIDRNPLPCPHSVPAAEARASFASLSMRLHATELRVDLAHHSTGDIRREEGSQFFGTATFAPAARHNDANLWVVAQRGLKARQEIPQRRF